MSEIQRGASIYLPTSNQLSFYENEDKLREGGIHYVMWSGGCDSTLLLYELLDRYGCDRVVAISYKYPWLLEKKCVSEQLHRNAFISKMKLRGEKFGNIRHTVIDINQITMSGHMINTYCGGLPQAVGWLLSIPTYMASGSYIYDGGIRTDDLSLVLGDYHDLFKSVSKVLDRNLILRQPYLCLDKTQIIAKLFHYDIYEETWFCEIPESAGIPCGKCVPCKTHMAALTVLATSDDDFIRLRANKELEKIKELLAKNKDIDEKGVDKKLCKKEN